MEISRIQIEGGFLDGFDLPLSTGLNVIIGARGTGKTSVIELIRYALNAKNHTVESKNRSLDHARAVLDGGEISVQLSDFIDDLTVTRSGEDESPRSTSNFTAPIVLSQTEIETLGLSESGRLVLLDGFITDRSNLKNEEATIINSIRLTYKDINSLESDILNLSENLNKLPTLKQSLVEVEKQLAQLQGNSKVTSEKQSALTQISITLSDFSVREETLGRFRNSADHWVEALTELSSEDFGPPQWNDKTSPDPLAGMREQYQNALSHIEKAQTIFSDVILKAHDKSTAISADRGALEKQSRLLRTELDKITEGTGALSRQSMALHAQIAQLDARTGILQDRTTKLQSLRSKRNDSLDNLRTIRAKRYNQRETVAAQISTALSPHVKVEVQQSAQLGEYSKSIANALRGSGMKYADLASKISENISPTELMNIVEQGNFELLSEILEIPNDRAARLIGNLKEYGLADILTCTIEDNTKLSLLDGVDYKDISYLSAGQRCTVILSIVLQHTERTLIIDQPEDHLDNAFIASTIIRSLKNRKNQGQIILSTHNANIPVLGDADLVIELTSDGRNGFIQVAEHLTHPAAVDAISNVMEGGRAAFQSRANFYNEHGS